MRKRFLLLLVMGLFILPAYLKAQEVYKVKASAEKKFERLQKDIRKLEAKVDKISLTLSQLKKEMEGNFSLLLEGQKQIEKELAVIKVRASRR